MRNKIGFITIGQAGGNIGQLFEAKGFPVLYLNTSQEDLDTLKSAKHRYHITGGEGCNKDRDKAKQLVIDDFDNIAAKIDDTLSCELLFVVFAAGGGTGSGAGPMLTDLLLGEAGLLAGGITIIPANTESIKTQVNAYECFRELTEIEGTASTFIIDNNKGKKMELNPLFVEAFTNFVDIPDKFRSDKGNIDKAEVLESLKAHGTAVVYEQNGSDMADILSLFSSGIFAPLENDKRVKYIAASCDEKIESFEDIQKSVGTPFDIFRGYSDSTHLLISGMSYPKERLEGIHAFIMDHREIIVNTLSQDKVKLADDIDFLAAAKPQPKKAAGQSRRDILNRYLKS